MLLVRCLVLLLFDFGLLDWKISQCGSRFSLARIDHANELFGVLVDAERDLLVLKIVEGVKMTEEELTEYEVLVIEFVKFVLCNGELTFVRRLEDVL